MVCYTTGCGDCAFHPWPNFDAYLSMPQYRSFILVWSLEVYVADLNHKQCRTATLKHFMKNKIYQQVVPGH